MDLQLGSIVVFSLRHSFQVNVTRRVLMRAGSFSGIGAVGEIDMTEDVSTFNDVWPFADFGPDLVRGHVQGAEYSVQTDEVYVTARAMVPEGIPAGTVVRIDCTFPLRDVVMTIPSLEDL